MEGINGDVVGKDTGTNAYAGVYGTLFGSWDGERGLVGLGLAGGNGDAFSSARGMLLVASAKRAGPSTFDC